MSKHDVICHKFSFLQYFMDEFYQFLMNMGYYIL